MDVNDRGQSNVQGRRSQVKDCAPGTLGQTSRPTPKFLGVFFDGRGEARNRFPFAPDDVGGFLRGLDGLVGAFRIDDPATTRDRIGQIAPGSAAHVSGSTSGGVICENSPHNRMKRKRWRKMIPSWRTIPFDVISLLNRRRTAAPRRRIQTGRVSSS